MNTMTYVNLLATAIVFAMFIYHILVGININMNCWWSSATILTWR